MYNQVKSRQVYPLDKWAPVPTCNLKFTLNSERFIFLRPVGLMAFYKWLNGPNKYADVA